jgi:phosphatidylserine/phosphatidylglycerophosphate/cardiolipin synthase-like enzyme/uncharacterized membrane protein YdjX (TVP38/TMEM64 family)
MAERILQPGRNCWRIEHAAQVAFLIDGQAYFTALYHSLLLARRSIYILAWDINSRFKLLRDEPLPRRWPVRIGDLLNTLVKARSRLHAYVLDWDFAMMYASDREWLPIFRFEWKTHRRLHFCMDGNHPFSGAHHQKVVVIDDGLAFSGGLDITKGRWDTSEHLPDDPRRCDEDSGKQHCAYHDLMMAVSGSAAAALGELARQRWARTNNRQKPAPERIEPLWPPGLRPDLTDVEVAIVRTLPEYLDRAEIREVEALYLDSIAAARHLIYIENQFLTAGRIGEAMAKRLEEDAGPEIVVVLPLSTDGWLSQNVMDAMRERLLQRLRQADRHDRLKVYYVHAPDLAGKSLNLHAKVMTVDDELVRIGSSNLNNRSMGIDSECDLAIEAAGDPRISQAISDLRHRLLAEHLRVTPEELVRTIAAKNGSTLAAIESLRGPGRSLRPLRPDQSPPPGLDLTTTEIIDPERPIDPDQFLRDFMEEHEKPSARRLIFAWVFLLVVITALAASWRWTPLNQWLNIDNLYAEAENLAQMPGMPVLILAAFVIGTLLAVPVTVLTVVTLLTFGTWLGLLYALAGSILGALSSFGLGRALGRNAVRRLAGGRLNALSQRLAQRGLLAVIAVRMVPIAPFTVINLVAGASHISFRDFLLGTAIGLIPGITAIALFTDRILASLQSPTPRSLAALGFTLTVIAVIAVALWRWLNARASHPHYGPDH